MVGEDVRLAGLERALRTKFRERSLLRQAVVHRSFLNERPELGWESYERLEYLGDAFLGWVVAEELYRRYPGFSEGVLTRARAALVQARALEEVAAGLELGRYLYLGQGEESSGGRKRLSNLSSALEAVLGAVLLDRGPNAARKLVLRWLGPRIERLGDTGAPQDAKSALQELAQGRGLPLPEYTVVEQRGPAHAQRFTVQVWLNGELVGTGAGRRKVEAEKAAAAQALERLGTI